MRCSFSILTTRKLQAHTIYELSNTTSERNSDKTEEENPNHSNLKSVVTCAGSTNHGGEFLRTCAVERWREWLTKKFIHVKSQSLRCSVVSSVDSSEHWTTQMFILASFKLYPEFRKHSNLDLHKFFFYLIPGLGWTIQHDLREKKSQDDVTRSSFADWCILMHYYL